MKPLSIKKRKILLIVLASLFILIAPFVLLKSFGYKLSYTKSVTQGVVQGVEKVKGAFVWIKTGGIYLYSNINGTRIYVNDNFIESSGLILRNTLIQGLDPNETYDVVVKKDGLHDWRKKITVYPSAVTEARVLMLPTEIKTKIIYPYYDEQGVGTTTIDNYSTSTFSINDDNELPSLVIAEKKDKDYLELATEFGLINSSNQDDSGKNDLDLIESSELNNITDDETKISTSTVEKSIPEYFIDLGIEDPDELENLIYLADQVAWLENENIKLHWIKPDKVQNYYYCLELENCRTEINLDWNQDILKFDFLPGRDDVFVVMTIDGIYAVEVDDRSDRNIQPIYLLEEASSAESEMLNESDEQEDLDFKIIQNDVVVYDDGVFKVLDL